MLIRHLDGESRFLNPSGLRVRRPGRNQDSNRRPSACKGAQSVRRDGFNGPLSHGCHASSGDSVVGHVLEVHGVTQSGRSTCSCVVPTQLARR
jgi:hypothetical protein